MAEDYSLLIGIAETSGRETFITDPFFNTIWTNSDRSISTLLLSADRNAVHGKPQKETYTSLSDGDILKITPVKSKDAVICYMFEVYKTGAILDLAAPSTAFREYARQYSELRTSLLELAARSSAAGIDTSELGIGRMLSSFSNKTALFTMLSAEQPQQFFDLSEAIGKLCLEFQKIFSMDSKTEFSCNIDSGLCCRAGKAGLKFAVSNLLSNARLYCSAEYKKITVNVHGDGSRIVIEISDNGTAADMAVLESSRNAFSGGEESNLNEGLGIAVADTFAMRNGGELSFEKKKDGLTARLTIPQMKASDEISLFSPYAFDKEMNENGIVRDIILKGTDFADIRYFDTGDKFIR